MSDAGRPRRTVTRDTDMPGLPEPRDIDTSKHFFDAFGHSETETSASYIVQFCQKHGAWVPFTKTEINEFYGSALLRAGKLAESSHVAEQLLRELRFGFNRLVDPGRVLRPSTGDWVEEGGGWIVRDRDGLYHITADFIERCYQSAPFKARKLRHKKSA